MVIKNYKISFNLITYDTIEESKKQGILGLLKLLKSFGIMGASRAIGIKDIASDYEEKLEFYFDGDGADRIKNIQVKMKVK